MEPMDRFTALVPTVPAAGRRDPTLLTIARPAAAAGQLAALQGDTGQGNFPGAEDCQGGQSTKL